VVRAGVSVGDAATGGEVAVGGIVGGAVAGGRVMGGGASDGSAANGGAVDGATVGSVIVGDGSVDGTAADGDVDGVAVEGAITGCAAEEAGHAVHPAPTEATDTSVPISRTITDCGLGSGAAGVVRAAHTDLIGATLRHECEHEKSSSRPTDGDKPYEGRHVRNCRFCNAKITLTKAPVEYSCQYVIWRLENRTVSCSELDSVAGNVGRIQ
jgi:hypothetical protein